MAATLQQNISIRSLKTIILAIGFLTYFPANFPSFLPAFFFSPYIHSFVANKDRQCLGLPQPDATWWSHWKIFSSGRSLFFFRSGFQSCLFGVAPILDWLFFSLAFGSVWWICNIIYKLSNIHINIHILIHLYVALWKIYSKVAWD